MSWIFGLIDEERPDPARLLDAATRALPGFEVHLDLSSDRRAAFGTYVSPAGETPGVVRTPSGLVAADARVDALGTQDLGSVGGGPAARLISDVVATRGSEGLDLLAADFAFASFDEHTRELLLTRDATGGRPLYWAMTATRCAFASNPHLLIALGMSDGDIEPAVCARFIAGVPNDPFETGLRGIRRVLGGRWLSVNLSEGKVRSARWFRPELDPVDPRVTDAAVDGVRDAIRLAVRDRARSGPVALYLSGGRDSGTLALALREEGVVADAYTMEFDPEICPSEDQQARPLAQDAGHRWAALPHSPAIKDEDLRWILDRTPLPLGLPFATSIRASHSVVQQGGARVVMQGAGGELFVTSPLATLDLLRGGRPVAAIRSARAFRRNWVYPYSVQLKMAGRTLAPEPLLAARERRRPLPPWTSPSIHRPPHTTRPPRSAADHRLRFLLWEGTSGAREHEDAYSFPDGIRLVNPFYDRRVIRAALRVPAIATVPDPEPKWLLTEAFLGSWARSRVKGDQEAWFRAVAGRAWKSHLHVFQPDGELSRRGLVDPSGLQPPFAHEWEILSSALVTLDMALRHTAK